jgi:Chitobiase/beta-hexosaminidase C-terminal domain
MRIARCVVALSFFLFGLTALAQDQAAQQALQQSIQDNQQAMQATQQAAQATQQANDQAMQAAQQSTDPQTTGNLPPWTSAPKISLKSGTYPTSTIVRLTDPTRHARIYYTTDGWTPTKHSTRYTGPISLTQDTTLQAIAIAPYHQPSIPSIATYKVTGTVTNPAPAPPPLPLTSPMTLPRDTPVRLVFTATVASNTAKVGDAVALELSQDLVLDGHLIAPRSTPATGSITDVEATGGGGAPGEASFRITALNLPGIAIPLRGQETKQGLIPIKTMRSLIFIPFVGPAAALMTHGQNADIPVGAAVTAYVARNTLVPPTTQPLASTN